MRILAFRLLPNHEFLAALRALCESHPGCDITAVLMTPVGQDAVRSVTGVRQIVVACGGADERPWWDAVRRRDYDLTAVYMRRAARPAPRAWPAYLAALLAPASRRILVSGGRTVRLNWVYLCVDLCLYPVVAAGAFLLWMMSVTLAALVLGADAVRRITPCLCPHGRLGRRRAT